MKFINHRFKAIIATLAIAGVLASCNEKIEAVPDPVVPATGQTLGQLINGNPNYSILRTGLVRTGLLNTLSAPGNTFTVFAPDNNAFINSGLSEATVQALPLATLTPVIQFHLVPTTIPGAAIPSTFPNTQMPTALVLPGGNPLVRMNVFPGKNGGSPFVNNMPVVQADALVGSNGVAHRIPFILQPPSTVLAQQIYTDPNHTLLNTLIQRADVGQTGLNRLDSVLKFGVANVTVFAPTNNAIKGLINVLSGGAVPLAAPDATFVAFINTNIPVATARGVVAYHLLGSRAFSVNLPLTTSTIQTLVGASPLPQLTVDRSGASPRLLGAGNGAGNFSNFTAVDRNAVNGVWHVIDRVLLPQ
jgi:uncharacterized surface protein with fasciclin (FAS1) repeats